MASIFINYHTHSDILQESRYTVRSNLEECPIIDLSIHRGHFVSLSVDSQRTIQKTILIYLTYSSYWIPFLMPLFIIKAKPWAANLSASLFYHQPNLSWQLNWENMTVFKCNQWCKMHRWLKTLISMGKSSKIAPNSEQLSSEWNKFHEP